MKRLHLRTQMLLLSIVPAVLIAALVTAIAVSNRWQDLERGLSQRGLAISQRLAEAADYNVFSGNVDALAALARSGIADPDIFSVRFVDARGAVLARASRAEPVEPTATLSFRVPIGSGLEVIDSLQDASAPGTAALGAESYTEVVMSRVALDRRQAEVLWATLALTLLALIPIAIGSLAVARRLLTPLLATATAVERIGMGDFDVRIEPGDNAPLRDLALGVNAMASRLSGMRDEMQHSIQLATAEAEQSRAWAERANLAKSKFLAMASHDLRQPMHALELFLAQLAGMDMDERARHLVGLSARSADALGALLDALLDISRLDAGVTEPSFVALPLAPLFERLEREFGPLAGAKGLQLRVVHTASTVHTDAQLFERILRNLLSNAITYTDSGSVMLACRRHGGRCRIEVRDSGPGIHPIQQALVFEEFVQVDNPERDRRKGLGLGLAIVDRLVQLLGHRIELRSAIGRGSTFTVTADAAPAPTEIAASADGEYNLTGVSVFVIDDDALVLEATVSLLVSWGCVVTAGDSAAEVMARAPASAAAPDLVLCDHRLRAGRLGSQEIADLRAHFGPDLKAALISGDTDSSTLADAAAADLPILHKPVSAMRLRALVQGARPSSVSATSLSEQSGSSADGIPG